MPEEDEEIFSVEEASDRILTKEDQDQEQDYEDGNK
jgi:hypothetical protein